MRVAAPPPASQPELCFLVLTKDESAGIATLIGAIRERWAGCDILLADDSRDDTAAIARRLGARVVSGGNRGLGAAYRAGLAACGDAARIVVLDGDGQADLADLPRFLDEMERAGADMVTGSRFLGNGRIDYRYPAVNRAGVWLLSKYLSLMSGQRFSDSHGWLRILKREVARSQHILGSHTYVQDSIVDAVEKGWKVLELPCTWKPRAYGRSKVVSSIPRYVAHTLPFLAWRALQRLWP